MTELDARAFTPVADDPNISVNWLEFYEGNFDDRIDAVCKDMSAERDVRRNHMLAILEVTEIRNIGADREQNIDVTPDPRPDNDSHSLILGIPLDDAILHQELADVGSLRLAQVRPYKKKRLWAPRKMTWLA